MFIVIKFNKNIILQKHQLDGIVLEIWSQILSRMNNNMYKQMPVVINHIALALKAAGYTFILVIPPAAYRK